MSYFWILVIIALVSCIIAAAIDYNNGVKDQKSRTALLWGYAILFALCLLALWFLTVIPVILIYGVAVVALVFFGRYLLRKIASRKQ